MSRLAWDPVSTVDSEGSMIMGIPGSCTLAGAGETGRGGIDVESAEDTAIGKFRGARCDSEESHSWCVMGEEGGYGE